MTYEPPPLDEPWTPGHDLQCPCQSCRAEKARHVELLHADMDKQDQRDRVRRRGLLQMLRVWFQSKK